LVSEQATLSRPFTTINTTFFHDGLEQAILLRLLALPPPKKAVVKLEPFVQLYYRFFGGGKVIASFPTLEE
jgi:hypothetical protein